MKYFSDPTMHRITEDSRIKKDSNTADTLVGRTLATEDTIRAWQSFEKVEPDKDGKFGEILSLVSIGSGVNGHVDISHGGFVGVLLDDALGMSAEKYKPVGQTNMTAYLKVYSISLLSTCVIAT
jgi:thioesterase superfamily protein 4